MSFNHLATHGMTLESLQSHGLIIGPTRCGKTTRVIAPLVRQLMWHISPDRGEQRHRATVVVLDLKGDMSLFEGCRREAEQSKLVFRWFTPTTGEASYAWNPLRQSFLKRLRNEEIVQLILAGLSLDFGEDYGRSWFMNNVLHALRYALKLNPVRSLRDLSNLMRNNPELVGGAAVVERAEHLVEVLEQMAEHPFLNAAEGEPDFDAGGDSFRATGRYGPEVLQWQIDIPQLLQVPQVVYFWLPIKTVGIGSRLIGRLFVHELMAATERHVRSKVERNQVYLWIDEFHELVDRGDKLARLFSQARSNGVSCLVSHQSPAQTRTMGANLEEVSREAVGMHLRMGMPSAVDVAQIELEGGEAWKRTSVTRSEVGISETWTERPQISRKRLLQMAATPGEALLRLREPNENGWGHPYGVAEFVNLSYHISANEYRERNNSLWPSCHDYPGTFVALPENPHYWGGAARSVAIVPRASPSGLVLSPPTQSACEPGSTSYVQDFLKRATDFVLRLKQTYTTQVTENNE